MTTSRPRNIVKRESSRIRNTYLIPQLIYLNLDPLMMCYCHPKPVSYLTGDITYNTIVFILKNSWSYVLLAISVVQIQDKAHFGASSTNTGTIPVLSIHSSLLNQWK